MSKNYTAITNKLNDLMRDSNFVSNHTAEALRAVNNALEDINTGNTGEPREVAYDFQKEIADVNFDDDYSEYTLGTALNYKFPSDLRLDSEDIKFEFVKPEYYFRKEGVFGSNEYMYTVYYEGNCHKLKINYETTDTLNFEYYSNNMVLDADATTRKVDTDGEADDTLLMPDRYFMTLIELTVADLYRQLKGATDEETIHYLTSGKRRLKQMIESIGVVRKEPRSQMMVRSEWSSSHRKITL